MTSIFSNYSLIHLNSFGFNVIADRYIIVESVKDILCAKEQISFPCLVLGGGSNILFTEDFKGTVLHPLIQEIEILNEDDKFIDLKVGAGVIWDDLVAYAVDNNWGGLENLSLIPGNVGASPVQNIGAYGVEVKDSIISVEGLFLDTMESFEFNNKNCEFSYRNSIFKSKFKNKTIITYVIFRLSKKPEYVLNYGNVEQELLKYGEVNLKNIRSAIISIRENKLPDPKKLGNAGSYFKNPIVEHSFAENLKKQYPDMPIYPLDNSNTKLAAGWLIEKIGMKGYRIGEVGVHEKQALVLVNYGQGKPSDIVNLAKDIMEKVYKKFGVRIEPEVNYL